MGCSTSKAVDEEALPQPPETSSGTPVPSPRLLHQTYEVQEQIGRGHYGIVFRGRHRVTGQPVAIKVLDRGKSRRERLRLEVEILRRVGKHANIVELLDVFETPTTVHLVFELMAGELFDRLVNTGPYTESAAAVVMKKLVEAVRYLHKNGVVHRDIKPENLLLTSNDDASAELKLCDFGLAKIVHNHDAMHTVCGTWAYSAPEVRVVRQPYTHKCDLWSLGVIMFVLLSAYHPFDPEGIATEEDLQKRIRECNYDFDDPTWDTISDLAKDLIRKLLVVDPDQRLDTGAVLRHPWLRQYRHLWSKQPYESRDGASVAPSYVSRGAAADMAMLDTDSRLEVPTSARSRHNSNDPVFPGPPRQPSQSARTSSRRNLDVVFPAQSYGAGAGADGDGATSSRRHRTPRVSASKVAAPADAAYEQYARPSSRPVSMRALQAGKPAVPAPIEEVSTARERRHEHTSASTASEAGSSAVVAAQRNVDDDDQSLSRHGWDRAGSQRHPRRSAAATDSAASSRVSAPDSDAAVVLHTVDERPRRARKSNASAGTRSHISASGGSSRHVVTVDVTGSAPQRHHPKLGDMRVEGGASDLATPPLTEPRPARPSLPSSSSRRGGAGAAGVEGFVPSSPRVDASGRTLRAAASPLQQPGGGAAAVPVLPPGTTSTRRLGITGARRRLPRSTIPASSIEEAPSVSAAAAAAMATRRLAAAGTAGAAMPYSAPEQLNVRQTSGGKGRGGGEGDASGGSDDSSSDGDNSVLAYIGGTTVARASRPTLPKLRLGQQGKQPSTGVIEPDASAPGRPPIVHAQAQPAQHSARQKRTVPPLLTMQATPGTADGSRANVGPRSPTTGTGVRGGVLVTPRLGSVGPTTPRTSGVGPATPRLNVPAMPGSPGSARLNSPQTGALGSARHFSIDSTGQLGAPAARSTSGTSNVAQYAGQAPLAAIQLTASAAAAGGAPATSSRTLTGRQPVSPRPAHLAALVGPRMKSGALSARGAALDGDVGAGDARAADRKVAVPALAALRDARAASVVSGTGTDSSRSDARSGTVSTASVIAAMAMATAAAAAAEPPVDATALPAHSDHEEGGASDSNFDSAVEGEDAEAKPSQIYITGTMT